MGFILAQLVSILSPSVMEIHMFCFFVYFLHNPVEKQTNQIGKYEKLNKKIVYKIVVVCNFYFFMLSFMFFNVLY